MIPLMRLGGAMQSSTLPAEISTLILNLLFTICTESTGTINSRLGPQNSRPNFFFSNFAVPSTDTMSSLSSESSRW
ncbi:hypothetical protein P692DRAFT_20544017 [Suillus brevipes Sb2]|nr:hypothetical protein P692DRAFT_20544017 [Suillus brevipes Sb2]